MDKTRTKKQRAAEPIQRRYTVLDLWRSVTVESVSRSQLLRASHNRSSGKALFRRLDPEFGLYVNDFRLRDGLRCSAAVLRSPSLIFGRTGSGLGFTVYYSRFAQMSIL